MTKQQFKYEVWKNHPERDLIKLVTRQGNSVTDFTDEYVAKSSSQKPLIGIVNDKICTWDLDGGFTDFSSSHDLLMILPEEPELWVNIYQWPDGTLTTGNVYKTFDSATLTIPEAKDKRYIGTYKIMKP